MDFIEKIIDRVKKNEKKKIVLPETDDIRTLEAAAIAIRENIADIYLIGKEEDILSLARENNISLDGCKIIEPVKFADFDLCVNTYYELRKKKGMTQSEVAEKAGLSDRAYADIERGTANMKVETVLRLCQSLNITPNDILIEDETPTPTGVELMVKLDSCSESEKKTAIKLMDVFMNYLNK